MIKPLITTEINERLTIFLFQQKKSAPTILSIQYKDFENSGSSVAASRVGTTTAKTVPERLAHAV